jgi:hypothetical protein
MRRGWQEWTIDLPAYAGGERNAVVGRALDHPLE